MTTSIGGCTLLMPLADAVGWPIDQVLTSHGKENSVTSKPGLTEPGARVRKKRARQ